MKEKYKYAPIFALCLLLVLYSSLNYIVIKQDTSPFLYDSAGFFCYVLRLYQGLISQSGINKIHELFSFWYGGTWHKPPMVMILSLPFYLLFGPNQDSAQMSNVIFIAILIFSTYYIGKRLRNATTGIMASCIVLTFPMIIGHSRLYWLDFPLTCWVALGICLLLYSDYFKNRLFSILLGIGCGFGVLIKQPFFFFLLGPAGFVLYRSLRQRPDSRTVRNIFIACGITLIIALSWHLPNLRTKIGYFIMVNSDTLSDAANRGDLLNFRGLIFNLQMLNTALLHRFYFYLFIICAAFFVRLKKNRDEYILLLWLIVPYLFFALLNVPRSARYAMPVLPAVALLISITINRLPGAYLRNSVYAAVICIGVAHGVYIHLSPSTRYSGLSYALTGFDREGLIRPDSRDWGAKKIISIVTQGDKGYPVKVAIFPDIAPLSGSMSYRSFLDNNEIEIILPTLTPIIDYYDNMETYRRLISQKSFLDKFDYIILLDCQEAAEFWGMQPEEEKELFRILRLNFQKNIREFNLSEKIRLPYGLEVSVYRRTVLDSGKGNG